MEEKDEEVVYSRIWKEYEDINNKYNKIEKEYKEAYNKYINLRKQYKQALKQRDAIFKVVFTWRAYVNKRW